MRWYNLLHPLVQWASPRRSTAFRFAAIGWIVSMRLIATLILIGVVVAVGLECSSNAPQNLPASDKTPHSFLGVAEDHTVRIEQENAEIDSRLHGITSMTEVQLAHYATYRQLKNEGRIVEEETRDGFVFFSIEENMHAPLPAAGGGAGSAYLPVTNRFKAPLPQDK
jgi:hypothetical protein